MQSRDFIACNTPTWSARGSALFLPALLAVFPCVAAAGLVERMNSFLGISVQEGVIGIGGLMFVIAAWYYFVAKDIVLRMSLVGTSLILKRPLRRVVVENPRVVRCDADTIVLVDANNREWRFGVQAYSPALQSLADELDHLRSGTRE